MRYPLILLTLLLVLGSLVAAAALSGVDTAPASEQHPRFATMDVGTRQAAQDASRQLLGWGVGSVMILIFAVCLCIGVEDVRHRTLMRRLIGLATVVFLAVFWSLMASWNGFVSGSNEAFWGPFPTPTTWLVFGIWVAPVLYIVIYVVGFRRWYGSDADDAR